MFVRPCGRRFFWTFTFVICCRTLRAAKILKNHICHFVTALRARKNNLICTALSIMGVLERLVLKRTIQRTSQCDKQTSAARVIAIRSLARAIVRSLRSITRSIVCSIDRSIARSLGGSLVRSLSRSVTRSLDHSLGCSLYRSIACWRSISGVIISSFELRITGARHIHFYSVRITACFSSELESNIYIISRSTTTITTYWSFRSEQCHSVSERIREK